MHGHELGDPCCEWAEGGPPPRRAWRLSHPGDILSVTGDQASAAAECASRRQHANASASASADTRFWAFYDGATMMRSAPEACSSSRPRD